MAKNNSFEDQKMARGHAGDSSEGEILDVGSPTVAVDHGLQRALSERHLQMIALGGVVGASIWYGTGTALSYSGPVGALVSFIVIGIDVFFVMQSLGELSTLYPSSGAFAEMAGRFIDPAVAVALGWNYWYMWVANLMAEYNMVSVVLGYWTDKVPSYGWILIFWAIYQGIAFFGVIVYGELEFWLALWKILCILAGYVLAILVNTGGIGGDYIGFRYWRDPGPFTNGINGFGKAFVLAAVYYSGTEMIAITAGESRNPRRDVPKLTGINRNQAIRQTSFRIVLIFLGMVFFSGIIVPSNDPGFLTAGSGTGSSPFSIALQKAGWQGAPNLINVFILTASFSAINSAIYISSRVLYSLATLGRAPAFLKKTTSRGVPIYAAILSNLMGLVAIMNVASGAGTAFGYILDIAGAAALIAWGCIGVTHLRFRHAWKLQGRSAEELPFRAFLFPYGAYFVSGFNTFLVLIQGYGTLLTPWQPVGFVFSYIILVLFILAYAFWKVIKRTRLVSLSEVDLNYGQRDL
ncbi:amino acid permease [Penicillium canariense]|uniref:Amino acid permease n=1 Tax=Penicillium canariense TaxID=189055 RepID=A0A9W9I094_9EURO|nr:amino acid permease [Penicillium canariense]KAJ5160722.1 amino acid permease [Penicillium canariense]